MEGILGAGHGFGKTVNVFTHRNKNKTKFNPMEHRQKI